jgi:hypothetical protein
MPIREICSPVQYPVKPAKLGDKPARHPGVGSTPRGESPGAYSDPGNLKKRPERVSNKA